jgi:uncharacterized alkaline shock family protein YloU
MASSAWPHPICAVAWPRCCRPTGCTKVEQKLDELRVKLYIIVEYGLNVAEVAGNVRSQVAYNIEKMIGRPVTALQIFVQGVRVGD